MPGTETATIDAARAEALRALTEIRAVVNRTTRYSTFSALSGLLAGVAALLGSGGCGRFKEFAGARADDWKFVYVWAAVFAFAVIQLILLTALKARQRGEAVWTPIARSAFSALLGPAIAGVMGSVVFCMASDFELLAGLWLLLYGCGLWAVSFFAPTFLRWLGLAFMGLGMVAWAVKENPGLWLGAGFGCLHLAFACVVLMRYRK